MVSFRVALVPLVAVVLYWLRSSGAKWHQGPQWQSVLQLYDQMVKNLYSECESKLLPTRFGSTQVHICGPPNAPPVFLIHGAGDTSLTWVPLIKRSALVNQRRLIAVDYICDAGRSVPIACPSNNNEHVQWVKDMFAQLGVTQADFVGHSYGAFVSASVAVEAPELVNKLVLLAPATVFADFTSEFWLRALPLYILPVPNVSMKKKLFINFQNWMTSPSYDFEQSPSEFKELVQKIGLLDMEFGLGARPYTFSDDELQRLKSHTTTTLMMPEDETVTDTKLAVTRAQTAGISVVSIPGTGHWALVEKPDWVSSKMEELLLA